MADDVVYNGGGEFLVDNVVGSADLRALLLAGASIPAGAKDPDLDFVADLLAVSGVDESAATNYDRVALASITSITNDASDLVEISCDPVVFPDLGELDGSDDPIRGLVVYLHVTNDADSRLVSIHTTNFPKALNGSDFTVNVPTGVIRLTQPA